MSYSGFYAGRWQPPLRRAAEPDAALGILLKRYYGRNPGPNRMHPRLGRLLMEPVVITVLARKPRDD